MAAGFVYSEAQKMDLKHSRWVFGNRCGVWYPVGSEDRDYDTGLTSEWIKQHTEAQAIQVCLSPCFNGAIGKAIKNGIVKDVSIA